MKEDSLELVDKSNPSNPDSLEKKVNNFNVADYYEQNKIKDQNTILWSLEEKITLQKKESDEEIQKLEAKIKNLEEQNHELNLKNEEQRREI